jgi:hypothetical protein
LKAHKGAKVPLFHFLDKAIAQAKGGDASGIALTAEQGKLFVQVNVTAGTKVTQVTLAMADGEVIRVKELKKRT